MNFLVSKEKIDSLKIKSLDELKHEKKKKKLTDQDTPLLASSLPIVHSPLTTLSQPHSITTSSTSTIVTQHTGVSSVPHSILPPSSQNTHTDNVVNSTTPSKRIKLISKLTVKSEPQSTGMNMYSIHVLHVDHSTHTHINTVLVYIYMTKCTYVPLKCTINTYATWSSTVYTFTIDLYMYL